MKSEPETFSIEHLRRAPAQTTVWDGVRNYQARNLLRDEMAVGDGVLFYHSSADPPGVAGTAEVARGGYPDASQFDPKSDHYDADARREEPRWYMVDIKLGQVFPRLVGLPELRENPALSDMVLLRKGSRLSVQPVTAKEWNVIVKLGTGH
ncbi:MAG TPA: EVE domain-containing protein [Polyangia bacterium]|nr:EVE domain-containing protein [Polyangia bacterium]